MVSHRAGYSKLGRDTAHRMAMLRNMVTSLFLHSRIQTTHQKAKAAQRLADKMITYAKRDNSRAIQAFVKGSEAVHNLVNILKPRYLNRPGGYTRVVRLRNRVGDNADMSYLELVGNTNPVEMRPAKFCDAAFMEAKRKQVQKHEEWQKAARL